ncbi:MAG: Polar amino acid ABC transporter, inner membrane subunit [Actinobacteria bacterium 66_15]|uniref:amino acid ABC transporter permease n=1 Tax=Anaerosoma tenue TaxID=2933588 RepID=UPI00076BEEFC|nr:amino acid ABC transporter permease [Anaerosoma tenue]KUK48995.1 MAG: Polar amino acid ABC transporter, inner membrane subunit [Actinobacteria bacterium 66_15]MCK8115381.1 amino acid ABC transporter permease [Anaerosoma tenue]
MDAIMSNPVIQMLSDPVLYIGLGQGLLLTLEIAGMSIVLSSVFGTIIGAMRYSGFPVVSHLATTYIEVVRNLPQLLLILVSYFVLGLPAMWAATIGLTIYTSAIIAEVIRGGLNSVPVGQWEAARSQGFSFLQSMRYIVLPPAVVKMIPPIVSQFVTVIKDSSFAMAIGAYELMFKGTILAAKYWRPSQIITIYIVISLVYFAVNFVISTVARRLQKKLSTGRGTIGN